MDRLAAVTFSVTFSYAPRKRQHNSKAKGKRGAATLSPKKKRRLPKTPSSHRWVLELRVLLLCIRPGYLKKPFKRERGTRRSLAFVITKGQTLINNRQLQRFWLRQREALFKSTTLLHRIHRKTTPLLTA